MNNKANITSFKKGHIHSPEVIAKIRATKRGTSKPNGGSFKKGMTAWNKGLVRTWLSPTEFKKGLIPWNKGKTLSEETKKLISLSKMGKPTWNKKDKISKHCGVCAVTFLVSPWNEARKFCSKPCAYKGRVLKGTFQKGHPIIGGAHTGHKHTEEAKRKIAKGAVKRTGPLNYRWISDRTKIKVSDRIVNDPLRKEWTMSVKNRDSWKCRISNGDCSGRLEAHHILRWKDYPELRYQINNGITLCHAHHPRTRAKEAELSPYFQELVMKGN
jgi:hypothetical protein